MKNRKLLIISFSLLLFLLCQYAIAQSTSLAPNLVPNSGFELGQNGAEPECYYYSYGRYSNNQRVEAFNSDIVGWKAFGGGSADWMDPTLNPTFTGNSSRLTHLQSNNPCIYDGRFVFLGSSGEAIGVKLDQKLIQGRVYILKISAFNHDVGPKTPIPPSANKYLQINFSDRLNWESTFAAIQSNIAVVYGDESEGCMQSYEFKITVAESNLEYLILNPVNASYNVDNVELYQEICHDELIITDKVFANKHPEIIQSKNITARNKTQPQPSGDWTVRTEEGRKTVFKAEEKVVLKPGFLAKSGSEFNAFIAPCGEPCKPAKMPDGRTYGRRNNISFCSINNQNCISLNNNYQAEQGFTYEWTSINPHYNQFIKDKSKIELNFCLGKSDFWEIQQNIAVAGKIELLFTVRDKCGNSITDTFALYWHNVDRSSHVSWTYVNWGIPHVFGFSHTPNMSKCEIVAYKESDPQQTEVEKRVYRVDEDLIFSDYHEIEFNPADWQKLDVGTKYCFFIRCYFYCDSNEIIDSERIRCRTW